MMRPPSSSLKGLKARFGTSAPRRQFLFERLQTVTQVLRNSGQLKRLYLFGSFLTATPTPNDVDLFVVMAKGFTTVGLREPLATVFAHDLCRIRYNIDVFWVTEVIGETAIEDMLDVFSRGRAQQPQGIVEVTHDPE